MVRTKPAYRVEWQTRVMSAPAFWYFATEADAQAAAKDLGVAFKRMAKTRVPTLKSLMDTRIDGRER